MKKKLFKVKAQKHRFLMLFPMKENIAIPEVEEVVFYIICAHFGVTYEVVYSTIIIFY